MRKRMFIIARPASEEVSLSPECRAARGAVGFSALVWSMSA